MTAHSDIRSQKNLWIEPPEADLATLSQRRKEDGGLRQNSPGTKANSYFSQKVWLAGRRDAGATFTAL